MTLIELYDANDVFLNGSEIDNQPLDIRGIGVD
jgi:hypothetical protein